MRSGSEPFKQNPWEKPTEKTVMEKQEIKHVVVHHKAKPEYLLLKVVMSVINAALFYFTGTWL